MNVRWIEWLLPRKLRLWLMEHTDQSWRWKKPS
jgi:hypothetical protein